MPCRTVCFELRYCHLRARLYQRRVLVWCDRRIAIEGGGQDQLDAVGNLIVGNPDAELACLVLHFFLKEELLQNSLRVIRLKHRGHLIGLLDLVELLANLGHRDSLIANLGHCIRRGGRVTRTRWHKIEQHAARQSQHDHTEKYAREKFLRVI